MYRLVARLSVLLVGLVILPACTDRAPETSQQRVVSLVPSVTEILFALGAEENLVGVTTFCDYPEEARLKQKVGDFSNPSVERILGLDPGLVFATAPEQLRIAEELEDLGVRTEMVHPESIDEVLQSIKKIGETVRAGERAEELVSKLRRERSVIQDRTRKVDRRPRVYVEVDVNPLFTAGRGSFMNELIELAGGENIVESNLPYLTVNPEIVIAGDPEIIVLAYPGTKDEVTSRAGWQGVSAVKTKSVHDDLDPNLITRPGPRCIEGALELFKKFHPEDE